MRCLSKSCMLVPVVCFLLCVLMGCSLIPLFPTAYAGSNDNKISVTLWYWNKSIDDRLLDQVSQHFPHIAFRALKIGGGYDTKLRTALAGHADIPDLAGINANIASYFPDDDQFVDIRTLANAKLQQAYLAWKWQLAVAPDGHVIALPMDTGPTALFYRADLFQQAGLPSDPVEVAARLKTWDDYILAGEQMKRVTAGRIHMFDSINNVFTQIMAQSPVRFFDTSNRYIGDQMYVRRAWQYAISIHQKDLSAKTAPYTTDWSAAISNGSIASFVGAVWMKHWLSDSGPRTAGKWRITNAPGGPGNSGGSFLAVTRASAHPKEAFAIAQWLTTAQNQVTSYSHTGLYPSTIASLHNKSLARPESFFGGQITTNIFSEVATHIRPVYIGPQTDSVQNILQAALTLVEMQDANPQLTWLATQVQIQRELSH
jgi:cellobiose transport system substrate-binding protein